MFVIWCGDRFLSIVSHRMINLDFHITGDGTKQFWGDGMQNQYKKFDSKIYTS